MAEIEQPAFDELATGSLSDVDEAGEAILTEAYYKGIAKLGTTTATYWYSLAKMGVPPKHATTLTAEWMHLCEGSDA